MSLARLIEIPPPFSLGRVGRLCNRSCNTILYISSVRSFTLRLHVLEKTLGNTPFQPTLISPMLTYAAWPEGSLTFTWAVPAYSFQILVLYAK